MAKITVTFHHGTAKIEVNGVQGAACQDLTASLEKALGTKTSDVKTSDYYEKAMDQVQTGMQ